MSGYRNAIVVFTLIFGFTGCINGTDITKTKPNYQEDLTMLMALDSERTRNYADGFKYYYSLYKMTGKEIYLSKTIYNSFKLKDFKTVEQLANEGMKKFNKPLYVYEYVLSLTAQKHYAKALSVAKSLLKKKPTSQHYELIANIYYQQQNYKEAIKYYESAYADNQNEKTLLRLVNILYNYLNKKDEALAYLETYVQTHKCNPLVCNKLMLIYQEQGNIDGMLSILTRMYDRYKDNHVQPQAIHAIQNLIVSLLEKKDIKQAIKFLEDNNIDQDKLINLYYQDHQLDKALKLTKEIYDKTKDPELLGKIAMYRFELAPDKRKVMKNVIGNFELAISSGINNAEYQNY